MRRSALLFIAVLASASLWAQRSDIYASKKTPSANNTVVTTAPSASVSASASSVPVVSESTGSASGTFDVDAYNRRHTSSASSYKSGEYVDEDGVVHDTVYVDAGSYAEGYSDATEDFEYAIRMARFHSPALSVLSSRFYWDLAYNWIDPWFYDPWFYDPWYYNPWYYGNIRYPYGITFGVSFGYTAWHSWMPSVNILVAYNYPYYYTGGYRYSGGFVPNRKINSSWDRKLTGGNDVRTRVADNPRNSEENVASRTAVINRESSRDSRADSRSVTSITRENVNARTSSSNSRNALNGSRISAERTASRSMNTTRANRNDVNRSSSARSNTGTDYNRPSSTERRNISEGATSVGRETKSTPRSSSSSRSNASVGSTTRSNASSSTSSTRSSNSMSGSSSSFSSTSRSSSSFGGSFSSGGGMSSGNIGGGMSGGGASRSAGASRR